jgi:hypothetical protein
MYRVVGVFVRFSCTHFSERKSVSTKTHRDIIVDHSSAMYMNVKLVKTFVKTEQTGGSLLWFLINHVLQVSARDVDRYDSEVVENATTSVYSSELARRCLPETSKKSLKCMKWLSPCSLSIQIAAGIPIC